jgi:transcriptional regulator with XRE-family HTH domain
MSNEKRLNKRQVQILEDMFSRLLMKETMEDIAKSHGISRKTLSQWKNTEHGKQLNLEFQRENSESFVQSFYDLVHEKMQTSFKDRELFAKLHGLLKPDKQEIIQKDERDSSDSISQETIDDIKKRIEESQPIRRVK